MTTDSKVLYIGDGSGVLEALENEFSVVEASGADELFEALSDREIDCVVIRNGGGIDGVDLLAKVRSIDADIPLILVGEMRDDEVEVVERALAADVTEYLPWEPIERNPEHLVTRVEKALSAKESRRTSMRVLERITDAFMAVDDDYNITYVNSEFENLMGVEGEEVIGENVWETFPAAKGTRFESNAYKAMEEQESVEYEEYYPPLESWFYTKVYPSEDGISVYFRDVTTKKQMEKRLEERERFLSNLISNLPGMVYRCRYDRDWTMEFVSDACIDITGYQPNEIIDNNQVSYSQIIDPEDRDVVWNQVKVALEERTPFQIVYRINTKEGRRRWVSEHGEGIYSEDGEVVAIEGVITDITELKMRKQRLEVLNRLMRHNLRNGLNVILGRAELLKMNVTDEVLEESVEEIIRKAKDISKLSMKAKKVEETLDPEKIRRRSVELVGIIEQRVEEHRREYPGVEITVETPDMQGVYANGVLDYAVKELLENATEHNDSEPPKVWVRILPPEEDGKVRLEIEDNGPGISESEKKAIYRGEETDLSHGSGLGLWLVNWIVNYSGGEFRIETQDGGTTVTLKLNQAELDFLEGEKAIGEESHE